MRKIFFGVRFPPELLQMIKAEAKTQSRSAASLIVHLCRIGLERLTNKEIV